MTPEQVKALAAKGVIDGGIERFQHFNFDTNGVAQACNDLIAGVTTLETIALAQHPNPGGVHPEPGRIHRLRQLILVDGAVCYFNWGDPAQGCRPLVHVSTYQADPAHVAGQLVSDLIFEWREDKAPGAHPTIFRLTELPGGYEAYKENYFRPQSPF